MFHEPPAACGSCAAAKIGFCAGLAPEDVMRLARVSRRSRYRRSRRIEPRPETPVTLVIIRDGTVKLSHTLEDGRQQIIDFLQPGDFALRQAPNPQRAESFEASTEAYVCEIGFGEIERLCADSPEINRALMAASMARIEQKNDHILMLGRKRAAERMASFLLDLSRRAGCRGEMPDKLSLPMSRTEIADYLSLTNETVSRALSQLRERAIIGLPKPNNVVILDFEVLQSIAAGSGEITVR